MEIKRDSLLKGNNFNILRLFAAIQVFFTHAIDHFDIQNELINAIYYNFFYYFPGVPIFYTISGFLIYASFDRNNSDYKKFYKNRILRIYPALIVCFLFTCILLIIDYENGFSLISLNFLKWAIAQLTFFQFYTPEVLRFWGVGTPNGSLWTISVEIQFYLIIPLIYFTLRRVKYKVLYLIFIVTLSIIINLTFNSNATIFGKVYHLFIFKYLYYFLFGVIAYIYFDKLYVLFVNKFLHLSCIYISFFLILGAWFGDTDIVSYILMSPFGFVANILLALWTLSAAFTFYNIRSTLFNKIDISYGIYIYHMPVINFLVERNLLHKVQYLALSLLCIVILSLISWFLIERPSLNLKSKW
jgi:peptidoglycan/LPS O-acetylase OafA/YrhL